MSCGHCSRTLARPPEVPAGAKNLLSTVLWEPQRPELSKRGAREAQLKAGVRGGAQGTTVSGQDPRLSDRLALVPALANLSPLSLFSHLENGNNSRRQVLEVSPPPSPDDCFSLREQGVIPSASDREER